jgi:nicotinate-nucleotide adenylyltransferase
MEVALFGGSFDPPHVGHVFAVAYVLSTGFDRALVVPALAHAFGKPLAPYEHRLAMTRIAMDEFRSAEVSNVEQFLGTPSRTLRTVKHLTQTHPEYRLSLVVGADVYRERSKWLGYAEIERLAPPFVLGRAGYENAGEPAVLLPAVSSTEVRTLLAETAGDRTQRAELSRIVPRGVLAYIEEHELYR